jgi:membrane protein YdbS with pleckstrin-like domain
MEKPEINSQVSKELERQASMKARDKSRVARWDIDIAILLFAVLIVVIVLLFQNVGIEIVSAVAVVGLALVWLTGWRRGNQLYKKFYAEELIRMHETLKMGKTVEETIEEKVQKEFLKRFH